MKEELGAVLPSSFLFWFQLPHPLAHCTFMLLGSCFLFPNIHLALETERQLDGRIHSWHTVGVQENLSNQNVYCQSCLQANLNSIYFLFAF